VLLAIHEHLGLANYFRVIIQALCNNEVSIIIPNLFGEVQEQSNKNEEDESFLKDLSQPIVAQTLYDVLQEIKGKNKKIIVVGLSIGSAIGLKLLEFFDDIEFSMFFYGLPPIGDIKPSSIRSRTIIYMGSKDRVKHLSDKQM
jgi:dienelactone hydrolase